MKWFSFVVALALAGNLGCSGKKEETKEGDKKLTLTAPGNVTIKQGTPENAVVKIKREKFDDAVEIELSGLPEKVTADENKKTIAKDATEVTFTLKADEKAPVVSDGKEVKVTATTSALKTPTTSSFKVFVKEKK